MRTKPILLMAMVSLCAAQISFALPVVEDAGDALPASSQAANNTLTTTPIPQNQPLDFNQAPPKASSLGEDILVKVNALEQEVQQLQGRVDELQHELKQTKEDQAKQFLILNQKTAAPVAVAPKPVAPVVALKNVTVAPVPEKAVVVTSSTDQDKNTYDAAYSLVSAKAYTDAIEAFTGYLKIYGADGHYAANANYWLGELNANQQQYSEAVKYLEVVVSQYPKSSKAADAMLKLGIINKRMGNDAKANEWFNRVVKDYPQSNLVQRAKEYLTA